MDTKNNGFIGFRVETKSICYKVVENATFLKEEDITKYLLP